MPDTDTTLTLHISMSFYNQVRQAETEHLHSEVFHEKELDRDHTHQY